MRRLSLTTRARSGIVQLGGCRHRTSQDARGELAPSELIFTRQAASESTPTPARQVGDRVEHDVGETLPERSDGANFPGACERARGSWGRRPCGSAAPC